VGLVFFFLFHWAHRFRYALVDLGFGPLGRQAWLFYGTAVAGTILAGLAAVRM
jgi:fumarate reductase subunit D